jgi:hypothetical protein
MDGPVRDQTGAIAIFHAPRDFNALETRINPYAETPKKKKMSTHLRISNG